MFKKAEKTVMKAKVLLAGTAGSGKTLAGLKLALGLVGHTGKIAVIDTTTNSMASIYADDFNFDTLNLEPPYSTKRYLEAIIEAEKAGYDALLIDSLSPVWAGEGGILEIVDRQIIAKGNKNEAWMGAQDRYYALINKIQKSNLHIICTLKSKTDYVTTTDNKGNFVPKKLGMNPIIRDGADYDFTITWDLDQPSHLAHCTTDHTGLFDNFAETIEVKHGELLSTWLNFGVKPAETAKIEGQEKIEALEKKEEKKQQAPAKISMVQCDELKQQIKATQTAIDKFLAHFKIETLSDMLAVNYTVAVNMLLKKEQEMKKTQTGVSQEQASSAQSAADNTPAEKMPIHEIEKLLQARKIEFKLTGKDIIAKPAFVDNAGKTFVKSLGAKWDSKEKGWKIAA